jgi:DNA-binding XRE family transcriptional regulator
MATFKEKFTNLWERRGLDQARMADLLGYSPQTFNKRVNGKLKMKRADILKSLEVLSSVSPVSTEDANRLLELAGYEGLTDANEPESTTVAQGRDKEVSGAQQKEEHASVESIGGFGFRSPLRSRRRRLSEDEQLQQILTTIRELQVMVETLIAQRRSQQ